MDDFFSALGLAMVIEGIAYALFPEAMRRMLAKVLTEPQGRLRIVGLLGAAAGVGVVWLARG